MMNPVCINFLDSKTLGAAAWVITARVWESQTFQTSRENHKGFTEPY